MGAGELVSYHGVWLLRLLAEQTRLIAPFWLGGLILGTALSVFGGSWITRHVQRLFGKHRRTLPWILAASTAGALSPITLFGVVPLIAFLGNRDLPDHVTAAFVVSSVMINPNLVVYSLALGVEIALARLFLAVLAGVIAGLLALVLAGRVKLFNLERFETKADGPESSRGPLSRFLRHLRRGLAKTGPNLAIGMLVSALLDLYLPQSLYDLLFGGNRAYGLLLAATMSVPLYYCGGGTIPIIRQWLDSGMPLGAAMTFMLAGPTTKITNLAAMKTIVSGRVLIGYVVFSISYAIAAGAVIDLLL